MMSLFSSKIRAFVWPVLLLHLLTIAVGSAHGQQVFTYGKRDVSDRLFLSRTLYSDVRDEPRNQTIVFKLFDQLPEPRISWVELLVNSTNPSEQIGDIRIDKNRTHSMEVSISVPNSRNVSVHLNVYKCKYLFNDLLLSPSAQFSYEWAFAAQSVTREIQTFVVVHVQKTALAQAAEAIAIEGGASPRHYNTIGRRQSGDRLLHFRSMNVTNLNRFAEREIEFEGNHRQAFSCVGFVFDSPTAVAYLNSSFVRENQITAILYDLSAPHFVANMSVFGYDHDSEQPKDFRPIMTVEVLAQ